MKRVERLKLFTGSNASEVEQQYNMWYDTKVEERSKVPALDNVPFKIHDRVFTIRNYDGEETYALAIFYEEMLFLPHEKGDDRGQGAGMASAFPSEQKKRQRRPRR